MERWLNKVAAVTGASSGIGAATVKALLDNGMIVVGLARRVERMENEFKPSLPADQQSRFHALKCDVRQEADIIRCFDWIDKNLGGVGVLINNAGIGKRDQIVAENNTELLRSVIDTNVMGVALCTREAFQSMKKRNFDGHILIVNSVYGHSIHPISQPFNMYCPSKYAVTAMTEVLRQEFITNQTKVKVTSISPGLVDTEAITDRSFLTADFPILNASDIADAIIFCIQTPPHVQIHELTIKPVGEQI